MDHHDTAAAGGSRFNVSRWALDHPALTRYLLVVLMLLGLVAYFQLGQDEDPPFTFRAMVVTAFWPGASAQQMADQVTDKIEKTLQEVPYVDKIRSYTRPGESFTILQVKDSTPPREVANSFYQVRKRIGDMRNTLPAGVIGPGFNDDFGDVFGSIFALSADGFSPEELRQYAERVREKLLRVQDVAKVDVYKRQTKSRCAPPSAGRIARGSCGSRVRHAQRAPQQQRHIRPADGGPVVQGVVVDPGDLLEHAQPALHHEPQFPAGAPGHAQRQRRSLAHQVRSPVAQ